ncbi:MAG TPA: hypothetical protein VNQ90_13095 [Chthoniobacteraceae bacterium]|nr:hypothetical protein [Chthoniobacteraceae bacterium]
MSLHSLFLRALPVLLVLPAWGGEARAAALLPKEKRVPPAIRGEILPATAHHNLLPHAGLDNGLDGWSFRSEPGVTLEKRVKDGVVHLSKGGKPGAAWMVSAPFALEGGVSYVASSLYRTHSAPYAAQGELVMQSAVSKEALGQLPARPSLPGRYASRGYQALFRGDWRRKTRTLQVPATHTAGRLVWMLDGPPFEIEVSALGIYPPGEETRPTAPQAREQPPSMETTMQRLAARPDSRASVEPIHGGPTLVVDGKPEVPFVHMADVIDSRRGYIRDFAGSGIPIHLLAVGKVWTGQGRYDLDKLDEMIWSGVARDPEGYFIIYLNLSAYKEWHHDFPDAAAQTRDGVYSVSRHKEVAPASYWSQDYQREALEMIRACVTHINRQPYRRAVIGYFLPGGEDGQFYYQAAKGDALHDGQSPGDLPLFRKWLHQRYGGDQAALRQAWNDPDARFSTARPALAETVQGKVFLDPVADRSLYDSVTFLNEGLARYLGDAASLIKELTPKPVVVGSYCGRGASFGVYPHFADTTVTFRERKLDFMGAQGGYHGRREAGSSGHLNWVYDSMRRANLLAMQELDFRTWRGGFRSMQHDHNVARFWNIEAFSAAVQRDAGRLLSVGGGIWWMEMTGGWFHEPSLMNALSETHRLGEALYQETPSFTPAEIVLVADEATYLWTTEQANVWNGPQYHSLNVQQRAFHESGLKLDFYYLSDLLRENAGDYKVYYFINPYFPSKEMVQLAHRLQAAGKAIVWQYAPGWMTENGFSLDAMEALTGFRFRHDGIRSEGLSASFVEHGSDDERSGDAAVLLAGLHGPAGAGVDLMSDRFTPVGGYDGVLTRFDAGNEPAAVWRRDPESGHLAVYLGHPSALTPKLLANLAEASGVHRFTSPGDLFVYKRDDLIVVHGVEGGAKRLSLPFVADVRELLKGEIAAEKVREVNFHLKPGETLWFQVERRGDR